jgi:hypothetical protein
MTEPMIQWLLLIVLCNDCGYTPMSYHQSYELCAQAAKEKARGRPWECTMVCCEPVELARR